MALLNLLSLVKAQSSSEVPWCLGLGFQHGSFEGLQYIRGRNYFVKGSVIPFTSEGFVVVFVCFLLRPNSSQKAP